MNEFLQRVAFEMQRYDLEACTDGTSMIIDGYTSAKVREGLTAADEPLDIVDEMNARSAVTAMRKPTDAMIEAGATLGSRCIPSVIYQRMIDEALR